MCGIGAILNLESKPVEGLAARLEVMNRLLEHRGPDGEGMWTHERSHVGFAHRRLEIIDLTTGQQPMHDGAGNWITYNGEIYNYLELRRELGEDSFRTTSDTEVVLRAYRRWGPACVERLRGMFAFALWDEAEGQLFCARDRFGIKPLYYRLDGGRLAFASEPKAFTADPHMEVMTLRGHMLERHARYVPVLDGDTLLGVVSFHDVAKAVYEEQSFENTMLKDYIAAA